MNKEIKTLWVEALRSGEYVQGKASLKRAHSGQTSYCCLGVLCELALKAGVVSERKEETKGDLVNCPCEEHQGGMVHSYFDHESAVLPDSVMRWAGLESETGAMDTLYASGDDGASEHLTALNDSGLYSFDEIADIIEEQF